MIHVWGTPCQHQDHAMLLCMPCEGQLVCVQGPGRIGPCEVTRLGQHAAGSSACREGYGDIDNACPLAECAWGAGVVSYVWERSVVWWYMNGGVCVEQYPIPWLLMTWRLTSPGHQQPWYCLWHAILCLYIPRYVWLNTLSKPWVFGSVERIYIVYHIRWRNSWDLCFGESVLWHVYNVILFIIYTA